MTTCTEILSNNITHYNFMNTFILKPKTHILLQTPNRITNILKKKNEHFIEGKMQVFLYDILHGNLSLWKLPWITITSCRFVVFVVKLRFSRHDLSCMTFLMLYNITYWRIPVWESFISIPQSIFYLRF